jgi:transposase, IS5 family
MRKNLLDQLPLTPATIDHTHGREIAAMGDILDRLGEGVVALVHEDLCQRGGRRVDPTKGRHGMAAEQVLRAGVLKQLTGLSYDALAFGLADSTTYRSFCRIGFDAKPFKKSTLQKNIKRVNPETWEAIDRMIVLKAQELGIEKGEKVRTDCTVVESNIHHPNDSSLLGDCVRVLARVMKRVKERFALQFHDRRRRAKRRVLGISNAKSMKERKPLYVDLMKITEETAQQAERIAKELDSVHCESLADALAAQADAAEIRHFLPLVSQVLSQTERRVLRNESVPANEKIVSIFEPHTDIIIKAPREVEYGHKVTLSTGPSALVTDIVIERGNPADATLATKMIERQKDLFGKAPKQVAFDGGFATVANLGEIKALGVKDVVFHKRRGIEIQQMASSERIYKKLRGFRAGIEGTISFLKRTFGLERCMWRSFDSFRAYVHASAVACNLLVVARHLIAAQS